MNRCKHGLLIGTCAICQGLVKTVGDLHCRWLCLCEDNYILTGNDEDQTTWYQNNRQKLIQLFYNANKTIPPYPKWPEQR